MRMMTKMLAGAAAVAGFAVATPAAAQYNPYYGYNTYNSYNGYTPYGYNSYAVNSQLATQQCSAAVQSRLYNRTNLASIIGSLVGVPMNQGRVVAVTSMNQTRSGILRVRGLASSGRYGYNSYSPYGVGAYGSLGYNAASTADLSFKCDIDARGYVRDLDINRR